MTRAEYTAIPAVNFSSLKHYLRSEKHFLHNFQTPQTAEDDTKAKLLGRAIHKLILEPDSFNEVYTYLDESKRPTPDKDYRTKDNAEWKKTNIEFLQRTGKEVVTKEEYDNLFAISSSVKANVPSRQLLKSCKFEEVISWTDKATGVRCKGIVDFLSVEKRMVGDLKTMEDASPNEFGKYIEKWMTYVQLAFYADGLEAIHGVPFNTAFVIAVEKNAPFVVQPYYLADDDIELGRTIYRSLLEKHAKCVEKGAWGGYEANYQPDSDNCINGVIISHLPGWAKIKAESTEFIQNSNK